MGFVGVQSPLQDSFPGEVGTGALGMGRSESPDRVWWGYFGRNGTQWNLRLMIDLKIVS